MNSLKNESDAFLVHSSCSPAVPGHAASYTFVKGKGKTKYDVHAPAASSLQFVPFAHTFVKGKGRGKDVPLQKNSPQALWEPVKKFCLACQKFCLIDSYVLMVSMHWTHCFQICLEPCYDRKFAQLATFESFECQSSFPCMHSKTNTGISEAAMSRLKTKPCHGLLFWSVLTGFAACFSLRLNSASSKVERQKAKVPPSNRKKTTCRRRLSNS